ncbi:TatD family hydrolase [Clavibacter michiganensis]|uniref:TatD family hydrolase n=1 Tax=Clavibacter michiganensis TaxID=28447 RepID=UPI000A3C8BB4|nr:TatD family deoxyribonuclease [Clavibacter michiganensis subsp. michiganensis]MWJ82373.1 TatD family deoxyribonuclease [Clavibacter michiganensis subsp. michiganensis]MWK62458.1 TatD family deoxyribonuclease [Clavibacter michiganensis subsp. michiganensis]OUE23216.1 putative deoxyribonuclease YcfH [Clavibacter michiganensis subsp. michiganensis]
MRTPPPLDTHAHLSPELKVQSIRSLGAFVFAVTRSLDEFAHVSTRRDLRAVWGVGVHPGLVRANKAFDAKTFSAHVSLAAFVGEVGIDGSSRVPLPDQIRVFRMVLEELQIQPRFVSVHSYGAHFHVLRELHRTPVKGVVLHWWTGSPELTEEAIRLGCYFSVPPATMSSTETLKLIPLDRILPETDHPYGDRLSPGAKKPGGVDEVERRIAMLHGQESRAVRIQFWKNLRTLIDDVESLDRFGTEWQATFKYLD